MLYAAVVASADGDESLPGTLAIGDFEDLVVCFLFAEADDPDVVEPERGADFDGFTVDRGLLCVFRFVDRVAGFPVSEDEEFDNLSAAGNTPEMSITLIFVIVTSV